LSRGFPLRGGRRKGKMFPWKGKGGGKGIVSKKEHPHVNLEGALESFHKFAERVRKTPEKFYWEGSGLLNDWGGGGRVGPMEEERRKLVYQLGRGGIVSIHLLPQA